MPRPMTVRFGADTSELDEALAELQQRLTDFANEMSALTDGMAASSRTVRQQDSEDNAAYWQSLSSHAQSALAERAQLESEAAAARRQQRSAEQRDVLVMNSAIAASASSSLMAMLRGRETFVQAAAGMADRLLQKGTDVAIKELLAWAEGETGKTAATASGVAARATAETAGAAETRAVTAAAASQGVLARAADAAAGAYSAMASIPLVGPALGAAAAAATFAAVAAYTGLFSAAGGWERVPYDNALTALHRDEMVLPASYAAVMRDLAASNGWTVPAAGLSASGGSFAPSISMPLTIHGGPQGMSNGEFRRMLSRNADHMVGLLANLHRNAGRPLGR